MEQVFKENAARNFLNRGGSLLQCVTDGHPRGGVPPQPPGLPSHGRGARQQDDGYDQITKFSMRGTESKGLERQDLAPGLDVALCQSGTARFGSAL